MDIKFLLLGVAALATVSYILCDFSDRQNRALIDLEILTQFVAFKSRFGKHYACLSELAYRQRIFAANLKRIKAHNADATQTYQLGLTKFSDLTDEEKKIKIQSQFPDVGVKAKCEKHGLEIAPKNDGNIVDWVAAKKVQAVKEEGDCTASWAFSAIGALESAYAIYNNIEVPNISEQELIDCSDSYGNAGCVGGMMGSAYDYILDHKINGEVDYPYIANNQKCNSELFDHGKYTVKGCVRLRENVQSL